MDNKEFGKKIELRTKEFAIRIIKLSVSLPSSSEGRIIKNQLTKSGTSVGANYREAIEILAIFTSIGKKLTL
jgi:four helix bundle protein